MTQHCPECGFVVTQSANYCGKCGAFLGGAGEVDEATTASYLVDESTGDLRPFEPHSSETAEGALVIRAGGGRAGQSFLLHAEKMTIGRSPNADVFLDDVTVSRNHAVLVRRGESWHLDDSGSLNGTYVNRERVDSHLLTDGDELQIGKYKLTYFAR